MYHISFGVLATAFQHSLSNWSLVGTSTSSTIPLFCCDPGTQWDTGHFHHPGDGFGCCSTCLAQPKCSTPSLSFHPQWENTYPFSRIKSQRQQLTLATCLQLHYTSAGINISALPSYRVSTFSIGSCFLAAALR